MNNQNITGLLLSICGVFIVNTVALIICRDLNLSVINTMIVSSATMAGLFGFLGTIIK